MKESRKSILNRRHSFCFFFLSPPILRKEKEVLAKCIKGYINIPQILRNLFGKMQEGKSDDEAFANVVAPL